MSEKIIGFSKLSREDKISWIGSNFLNDSSEFKNILNKYLNTDTEVQTLHNSFSENSISNFYLPYSVSPNFLINNKNYCIPLVSEESSVVAALSNSSKFWFERGGFKSKIINKIKTGQIHFKYKGRKESLIKFIDDIKLDLIKSTDLITKNMRGRGGGIEEINLVDKSNDLDFYFQLSVDFNTVDSMGANFINSCLEQISITFERLISKSNYLNESEKEIKIIMSILSNYTPDCLVEASAECDLDKLGNIHGLSPHEFSSKFKDAFDIAKIDTSRAVTHNKGIMNGIDAVVIATGNDFRAVESGAHAYASKSGAYKSLTKASIKDKRFSFSIEVPLALGTVGGLTKLHPLANLALEMLDNPNAEDLMQITAVAGLAQNFAAIKSLITTGIQHGHMKMHLINMLNQHKASDKEKEKAIEYFKKNTVSHLTVEKFINKLRSND